MTLKTVENLFIYEISATYSAGRRITCAVTEGLIEEGKDLVNEIDKRPILNVALIGAAKKVERDETTSYTTLIALASKLRYTEAFPSFRLRCMRRNRPMRSSDRWSKLQRLMRPRLLNKQLTCRK
ncbi:MULTISPECIES: DUF892 family protein [unclassified Acidovorax]|uniref:DUF892 family protein n=1 Tax=unclassified Acidovorax TaxID=2684926 RepID=UPI0028832AB9|nr:MULTISPECIES: DUF892 family protein [unclassified Acidovorax]